MTSWGDLNYTSGIIADLRRALDTFWTQMLLTKVDHCETVKRIENQINGIKVQILFDWPQTVCIYQRLRLKRISNYLWCPTRIITGLLLLRNFDETNLPFLTLKAPISQNAQTHSNNSSANCRRIVWVCMTILWDWRLKG